MSEYVPVVTNASRPSGGPTLSWAREVLSGAVFSDGFLSRHGAGGNSYFSIQLSGKEHIDWLHTIKRALLLLGVEVPDGHPYVFPVIKKGKLYEYCFLRSHVSPTLTRMRDLWYPDGVKEVLEDFHFTLASLANAFMGDGNSSLDHRDPTAVHVRLCTQKFSLHSIGLIEEALCEIGILNTGREHCKGTGKGAGIGLSILQDSVNRFMRVVEPYIEPSYRYKVKYRRGS